MQKTLLLLGVCLTLSGCASKTESAVDPGPWSFALSPSSNEQTVCQKLTDEGAAKWVPIKGDTKNSSNYLDQNSFQFQQHTGKALFRQKTIGDKGTLTLIGLKMADCQSRKVRQGVVYIVNNHKGVHEDFCKKVEDSPLFVWVSPGGKEDKSAGQIAQILNMICKP
jgi:hypothetical protein